MRRFLSEWIILALAISAGACDGGMSSQASAPASELGPDELQPAPGRKTTNERIARVNMDAAIQSARRQLEPDFDLDLAAVLVEQLMLRATFYGTYDDWEEASEIAEAALERHADEPAALFLRAAVLNTLHEFDHALVLVRRAQEHMATSVDPTGSSLETRARRLEGSIELARSGASDDLVADARSLARSAPTYQNITSLALVLAEGGRFDEADAAFRKALEGYRDVSPFPFAWVAFQRGVMWSEQADRPDLGRDLYAEALRYLPNYVLANVHLAELDAAEGDLESARERVEPLVGRTQDPEPLSLLADIDPSPGAAARWAAEAEAAYEALVERFPEAFLHHLETR